MKKILLITIAITSFATNCLKAQTTAVDFNRTDCNGNKHHLFATLDSTQVVVLEFFMINCTPCITAGKTLEPMLSKLQTQYNGRVKSYKIGYTDSYTCQQVKDWVKTNSFNATPLDSGAAMVAYYGGFGMPSIIVVAGNKHEVLFNNQGFTTKDTTTIGGLIRNFFKEASIVNLTGNLTAFTSYPNPVSSQLTVSLTLKESSTLLFRIVNLQGQIVKELPIGKTSAGAVVQQITVNDIATGTYLLQAKVNGVIATTYKFNVVH